MTLLLNTFVKLCGCASTGGEAKQLIRSGVVLVNGQVETRNKRQLVVGDVVVISGKTFVVDQLNEG